MNKPSSTYLLIEGRLGSSLEDLVLRMRGDGLSWDRIVLELHKRTDTHVTAQTLRNWFPEHAARAVSA